MAHPAARALVACLNAGVITALHEREGGSVSAVIPGAHRCLSDSLREQDDGQIRLLTGLCQRVACRWIADTSIECDHQRFAGQRNQSARTYVAIRGETHVIGYYSMAAASAEYETVPARIAKGLAQHPIPLTLLARLAVDQTEQGAGIGAGLLKDALKRFLQAQSIIAARALVVHAKDEPAVEFCQPFGFVPSPLDPYHLYLMTKDIHECLA